MDAEEVSTVASSPQVRAPIHPGSPEVTTISQFGWNPTFNIYSQGDGQDAFLLVANLAGVEPSSIEIWIDDDALRITGVRPAVDVGKEKEIYLEEAPDGRFSRRIRMPAPIDATMVTSRYDHGRLVLTLPRRTDDSDPSTIEGVGPPSSQ